MKNLLLAFATGAFLIACSGGSSQESTAEDHSAHEASGHEHTTAAASDDADTAEKKKPLSPRTASMANIGDNHVHVDYGSPSKRGRMIFGGLVGFGQVWATGAHKATFINFGKDVEINGVEVPAGKYGLFTIPGEEEWTIIVNKDWDMHLADEYDASNDVVRVQAPARQLDEVVESLTFEVNETGEDAGNITIMWDLTAVSFDVKNR